MKKCTFFSFCGLMIVSTLLLSVNSYAVEQKLDIKAMTGGMIYFTFPNPISFTKTIDGVEYAEIKPLTCEFSTKYAGTIYYHSTTSLKQENFSVDNSHPYTKQYSGYYPYSQSMSQYIDFYNTGCSSSNDGDSCIEAKQQHLDNLIVNCY